MTDTDKDKNTTVSTTGKLKEVVGKTTGGARYRGNETQRSVVVVVKMMKRR